MTAIHYRENEFGDARAQIDDQIARGQLRAARAWLRRLYASDQSTATASFVADRFGAIADALEMPVVRVAALRSFTIEPMLPFLRSAAFAAGLNLNVRLGAFNAYSQEILSGDSWIWAFEPDVIVLAWQGRDLIPKLYESFADIDAEAVRAEIERFCAELTSILEVLRSRTSASILLHSLASPPSASFGIFDTRLSLGQARSIAEINARLQDTARALGGAWVIDLGPAIARDGWDAWHDERMWWTARMPYSPKGYRGLAREWNRYLQPLCGKSCKVLVTDLDNTLWGGVVGEDGPSKLKMVEGYPGAAYRSVQRALLDLHRRGVLLAIASKNNTDDALEVLRTHGSMLLRPEHFASMRIGWGEKAQSLREIAAELNVGIDSLAFLDDNPAERALVALALPEVTVLDLPEDPGGFSDVIRAAPGFERLALSAEDTLRTEVYAAQREREDMRSTVASLEDYYRELAQEVEIRAITAHETPRVAQLTQKTNQFNLTTRRYSEHEIELARVSSEREVLRMSVRDRFGDNGIVGVALLDFGSGQCDIDTFLMSCRVIGRTVETAMLAHVVEVARERGATVVRGKFVPTPKNAPAADFYPSHGFVVRAAAGGDEWELDVARSQVRTPDWIRIIKGDSL